MEQAKENIKQYVTTLDGDISEGDMLDLVVDLTLDRVLLYLNESELPSKLERVVAQVVTRVFYKTQTGTGGADRSVSYVSDNGQTIQYTTRPQQYLDSSNDEELFAGFERLLNSYRRPHVITE